MIERINPWLLLMIAIVAEITGSVNLKASQNFSQPIPSILMIVGFGIAFYLLSIIVKRISLGIAYAVWGGIGTALTALLGVVMFGEQLGTIQIIAIVAIVAGAVILNLNSETAH
jgi:small multidrug resistance pump